MDRERVKRILEKERVYSQLEFYSECDETKRQFKSSTVLKMQWMAERIRKVRCLKAKIQSGNYSISSEKLAKSLINCD